MEEKQSKIVSGADQIAAKLFAGLHLTEIEHGVKRLSDIENKEFDFLFREYYRSLRAYAYRYVNDLFAAEDIVQDVFLKLWEKRDMLNQIGSIRSYLFSSVFNAVCNFTKHKKVEESHQTKQSNTFAEIEKHYHNYIESSPESLIAIELEKQIMEIINKMPAQCKNVFVLSRFHNLKNQEIAAKLNITVKAVEKQMTKALQIVRTNLKDYLKK